MAEVQPTVGWIGVGAMGLPMLGHLTQAGWPVIAHDLQADALRQARARGARTTASAADLACEASWLCTMVYDDAALLSVHDAVARALRPGQLWIDFSTVAPAASARLAERLAAQGVGFLRAPVSGSVSVAEAGALSVFASGDAGDFERARRLLSAFAASCRYVGSGEAARVVKLAINMLLVNHTALLGESLALAHTAGVPRAEMVACINESVIGSRHTQARADALATRRYGHAGPLAVGAKDVDMALALARDHSLGLPMTAYVRQYLTELLSEGHGATEISLLAEFPQRSTHREEGSA